MLIILKIEYVSLSVLDYKFLEYQDHIWPIFKTLQGVQYSTKSSSQKTLDCWAEITRRVLYLDLESNFIFVKKYCVSSNQALTMTNRINS